MHHPRSTICQHQNNGIKLSSRFCINYESIIKLVSITNKKKISEIRPNSRTHSNYDFILENRHRFGIQYVLRTLQLQLLQKKNIMEKQMRALTMTMTTTTTPPPTPHELDHRFVGIFRLHQFQNTNTRAHNFQLLFIYYFVYVFLFVFSSLFHQPYTLYHLYIFE